MPQKQVDTDYRRFVETGDREALARVFDATAKELFRMAYAILQDRGVAEDLLQQTFLVAIEDRKRFQPDRAVKPWLRGVLSNRLMHVRRERARRRRLLRCAMARDIVVDPAAEACSRELEQEVDSAIARLAPIYRQPLLLVLRHGLTPAEASVVLDRSAATVRTQLARGLEMLQQRLSASRVFGLAVPSWSISSGSYEVRSAVFEAPLSIGGGWVRALMGGIALKKVCVGVFVSVVLCGLWILTADSTEGERALQGDAFASGPTYTQAQRVESSVSEAVVASDASVGLNRVALASGAGSDTRAVRVTVCWQDASPAAGVGVRCVPHPLGSEAWQRFGSSGSDGTVEFDDLNCARVRLLSDRGNHIDVDLEVGGRRDVRMLLPRGRDLRGRVVDERNVPIAGAAVWLAVSVRSDDAECVAHSGADGSFRIRAASSHDLIATAPGYCSASPVRLSSRSSGDEVVLRLRPASASLFGHVVDSAGRAVAEARILVGVTSGSGGWHQRPMSSSDVEPWPSRFARTNERGQFRLDGLAALPWPVWVAAPGYAPLREVVAVRSGENRVRFQLGHGAVVRGIVRGVDGSPVAGASISTWRNFEPVAASIGPNGRSVTGPPLFARRSTTSDSSGLYVLRNVLPGRLHIHASAGDRRASIHSELAPAQDLRWDVVIIGPKDQPRCHGTLLSKSGRPLAGWIVAHGPDRRDRVETDEHGEFRSGPIAKGERTIVVEAPPYLGSRKFDLGSMRLTAGALRLRVPVEPGQAAVLRGAVVDSQGESIGGCLVGLRCTSDVELLQRADSAGVFRFEKVPHGAVSVWVSHASFGAVDLQRIQVRRGEELDLGRLRVPRSGEIEVEIVDAAGKALPASRGGEPVVEVLGQSREGERHALIEVRGARLVGNLQPGSWRVQTRYPLCAAAKTCTVLAGRKTSVRIVVPAGVAFQIHVPEGDWGARQVELALVASDGSVLRTYDLGRRAAGADLELVAPAGHYHLVTESTAGVARKRISLGGRRIPLKILLPIPGRR